MSRPAQRPLTLTTTASASTPGASTAAEGAQAQALSQLLKIESEARRARSIAELDALLVNDGQRLVRSRQAFAVATDMRSALVVAASSTVTVDAASPMIGWIGAIADRLKRASGHQRAVSFKLPEYAPADDNLTKQYPFRDLHWQPLWSPDGQPRAGILYLREHPWTDAERSIAARLAESFGHARALLSAAGPVRAPTERRRQLIALGALALVTAIGALPVPISVLAPLEVVPRNADVIAMTTDGIVQRVLVAPNALVAVGDPLVRLVDTVQRNRAEIAEREVQIAAARVEKATSLAFSDPRGREDLGIARVELELKRAELAYARDVLQQTVIRAECAGLAIFSDPRDLEGRPLATGDRLMLIAREGETEFKIALPAADSIVLRTGLQVKGFLDSDPLNSVVARITAIDRQVRVDDMQTASYRITARLGDQAVPLTLGARGTAQIQGDRAPLALTLFRRPLTAARQWVGL